MRFGVIGTNFITDRFINAGRLIPGFELVAVGSRTPERGNQFSEKHGIPYVFTDFENMAESGLIDAVYVATPNYSHCAISRLFLAHGVHVLCEKPFAINEKEVISMIETARENNVKIMEASRSIYMPEIQAIKSNLHRIGQTRRVILQMSRYSSRYDLYLQGKPTNTFDVSLGNGAIMDMGVYNIQLAVFLFGYPNTITATGTILEDGKGIELNTSNFKYGTSLWLPRKEILAAYKELGGEIFTMGSDTHEPAHFMDHFDEAQALVTSLGFKYYCTYKDHEPSFHKFD